MSKYFTLTVEELFIRLYELSVSPACTEPFAIPEATVELFQELVLCSNTINLSELNWYVNVSSVTVANPETVSPLLTVKSLSNVPVPATWNLVSGNLFPIPTFTL